MTSQRHLKKLRLGTASRWHKLAQKSKLAEMEIYRETMIRSISLSISNYLHSDHSISKIHEISTVLCQFGGFQSSSRSSIIQSSMHRGCRAATEMLPHIVKILEILPAKPWTISSTGGFMEDIQLYLMGCVNQFIMGV